jgi:Fe-S cluster assembly ATP-binding protein
LNQQAAAAEGVRGRQERTSMTGKAHLLQIEDLHVAIDGKEIVKGLSLTLDRGQKIAVMGPNGSGKSTLTYALMGHPAYQVTAGSVKLDGEELLGLPPDERARKGMFLAFQYPTAIPGVSVANFLRSALKAHRGGEVPVREFRTQLMEQFAALEIDKAFAGRYVNDGFSGGEKKRLEILQMAMLKPRVALLDETDSGLDIDALKLVSQGITRVAGADMGVLLVTHYQRILGYVKPDTVHVLMDGRIVRTGGPEFALELEEKGYDWIEKEVFASKG